MLVSTNVTEAPNLANYNLPKHKRGAQMKSVILNPYGFISVLFFVQKIKVAWALINLHEKSAVWNF